MKNAVVFAMCADVHGGLGAEVFPVFASIQHLSTNSWKVTALFYAGNTQQPTELGEGTLLVEKQLAQQKAQEWLRQSLAAALDCTPDELKFENVSWQSD